MRAFGEEDIAHILSDGERTLGYVLQGVPEGLMAFIADAYFDGAGASNNVTARLGEGLGGYAETSLGGGVWGPPEPRLEVAAQVLDCACGLLRFAAMTHERPGDGARNGAVRAFAEDVDALYYAPTLDAERRERAVEAVAALLA